MTLQFQTALAAVSRETGGELGGALIGEPPNGAVPAWPVQRIFAPLFGSTSPVVLETWTVAGQVDSGTTNGIAWRKVDGLLYGVIDLNETAFKADASGTALQFASTEAYRRIFHLIDSMGVPHLWRVWNYLDGINRETHGLERYRQFNIGRQDAFLGCHRGAAGNVPAACALGLAGGPLSIAFLAGATPAVPVENPRQVSAYDYPTDYGPRSPTFSRGALVYPAGQEFLFISGTASIVGHKTVHRGDVVAQTREAMANIAAVVGEANQLRRSDAFSLAELHYRIYLRHAGDFCLVRDALSPLIGGAATLFVQADICRHDLLVEIEAMASHSSGA